MSACFWFVFSLLCVVAAYRLLRWSATFPLPRPSNVAARRRVHP